MNVVIIIIALKKIYRSSHVKLTEASDDYMKTSALKAMLVTYIFTWSMRADGLLQLQCITSICALLKETSKINCGTSPSHWTDMDLRTFGCQFHHIILHLGISCPELITGDMDFYTNGKIHGNISEHSIFTNLQRLC